MTAATVSLDARAARLALVPSDLQHRLRVDLLAAVVDRPGIRMGALAWSLGVRAGVVAEHVQVLVAASMIEKPSLSGPDAGALRATPEGVRWLWFAQQVIR